MFLSALEEMMTNLEVVHTSSQIPNSIKVSLPTFYSVLMFVCCIMNCDISLKFMLLS